MQTHVHAAHLTLTLTLPHPPHTSHKRVGATEIKHQKTNKQNQNHGVPEEAAGAALHPALGAPLQPLQELFSIVFKIQSQSQM